MKKSIIAIMLLLPVLATGNWAKQKVKQGARAYIYGYPLVVMDATRNAMLEAGQPENQFRHNLDFPDHDFRNVVRPNNDTLYSIAWLNLENEPVVLSVPASAERYYVMPFMDAFTNVFATVGTRETGHEAGNYFITGPNWHGDTPAGMKRISAPTDRVWLIGRIQTNGVSDISRVSAMQRQFGLNTLSSYMSGDLGTSTQTFKANPARNLNEEVDKLTAQEFFTQLGALIQITPTPEQDEGMLALLADIGISREAGFTPQKLNHVEHWLLDLGTNAAKRKLRGRIQDRDNTENGWVVIRSEIGNYGTNYPLRAAVAMFGLGALPTQEASYPKAMVDVKGNRLSGEHAYTLHFEANQLPPVSAFWSLSMYDQNGFFVSNPIRRYSISDRDNLNLNEDGSLTIHIQHHKPETKSANWLPSPQGIFELTLRLYLPDETFVNGDWRLPAIQRQN